MKVIKEEEIKNIIANILNEEVAKVSRNDFSRVQYKLDELDNSISEAFKELRKFEDVIPSGLDTITNSRVISITNHLNETKKLILQLKEKIKTRKKSLY